MKSKADSLYKDGQYLAQNPDWHLEDSPWKARNVGEILRRNGITPRSLVDIGCGAGGVLDILSHKLPNTKLVGYEISPDASAFWPNLAGRVEYRQADFLKGHDRYNVLLLLDVFEHVEDYMGFLRRLLDRADYFIFHIPLDIYFWALLRGQPLINRSEIGHLHYFWKASALATLQDTGYEMMDFFYTAHADARRPDSMRSRIAKLTRSLLLKVQPDLAVLLLGGFSLMVLARPAEPRTC